MSFTCDHTKFTYVHIKFTCYHIKFTCIHIKFTCNHIQFTCDNIKFTPVLDVIIQFTCNHTKFTCDPHEIFVRADRNRTEKLTLIQESLDLSPQTILTSPEVLQNLHSQDFRHHQTLLESKFSPHPDTLLE